MGTLSDVDHVLHDLALLGLGAGHTITTAEAERYRLPPEAVGRDLRTIVVAMTPTERDVLTAYVEVQSIRATVVDTEAYEFAAVEVRFAVLIASLITIYKLNVRMERGRARDAEVGRLTEVLSSVLTVMGTDPSSDWRTAAARQIADALDAPLAAAAADPAADPAPQHDLGDPIA